MGRSRDRMPAPGGGVRLSAMTEPTKQPEADLEPAATGGAPEENASEPVDEDASALTYEQAVARLQEIIERIEAGEVGLEESLQQYERGMAMIKRCQAILDRAEAKIRKLTVTEQGGLDESSD